MSVEIREVTTRRDMNRFIRFPYDLYRGSPYYVPTLIMETRRALNPRKNPAFDFCRAGFWTAEVDGRVVGRVAGIINGRFVEKWGSRYARFGWIDFIDDRRVSSALIARVERWARDNGMEAVHGPLGFTDLDQEGMLVSGFDEMGTLPMIYNFPYYPEHLEALGYVKDADWLEFDIRVPEQLPEKIAALQSRVLQRSSLHMAKLSSRRDALKYAPGIFDVLNAAYKNLYGVTPLDDRQIDMYIKMYFGFVNKDFVEIILDENEEVVAFGLAMPRLAEAMRAAWGRLLPFGFLGILRALAHPKSITLYLVAVRPDYQGRALNALIIGAMWVSAARYGVTNAESSGHLEDNKLVQAFWKQFDCRQHKRRRVYIRRLNEDD